MAEVDRERILVKVDALEGYLRDLCSIAPRDFQEYRQVEKKRACERLLQLAIEVVIDICCLFVSGLRLGLPAEEADLFGKLTAANVLSTEMGEILREMKGFRNILVHEYAAVDDRLVYEAVKSKAKDFRLFTDEVRAYLGG